MGLLGLESNAFLSDRIFESVDKDKDHYINFDQFAALMDVLINGDEDDKLEFSFSLIDKYMVGYFSFDEFKEVISKIIAHWCIITGS
jgi:Ca2+-binding EF-hand superfamily protein